MGWSYRKSIGGTPFRINFSGKGFSNSLGIKGIRVNVKPQGTYVSLSAYGITYRQKIPGPGLSPNQPVEPVNNVIEPVGNIVSSHVEQLTDTDSQAFITELNQKKKLASYAIRWGLVPFFTILIILLFTSFRQQQRIIRPASDSSIVRIRAHNDVNIRKEPDIKSQILQVAPYGEAFLLIDTTNREWLKVGLYDTVGYVKRELADIDHISYTEISEVEWQLMNDYLILELIICFCCFIPLMYWLKKLDKERSKIELYYDMDEKYQQVYQQFSHHFATFSQSSGIWQYLNAQRTTDLKRNAGAGELIKRIRVGGVFPNKSPLPYFVTNVAIPSISLNNMELYFLPERLLIKRDNTFAAVFYKNLKISSEVVSFVESDILPEDARVLTYTWLYVNKSGEPDRRFNNNRELPVCAYSVYMFTSETGIFEVISTSKLSAMDDFSNFLLKIGELQARIENCYR